LIKKLSVASAIAIVIIVVLTIEGWLTPIEGVILGVLAFLAPIIVIAIISTVITNALAPKPSLKIKNVQFVKKNFQNIDGYQIKAEVTNKGKKICLKLDAAFQIEDKNGKSPNLLHVNIEEDDGHQTVSSKEEPMRGIDYAWIDEKDTITKASFEKLRQKDSIGLLFPYETTSVGFGDLDGSSFRSYDSETLLKIEPATDYYVTITVKGEDSDSNTVSKSMKSTLSV
jgi:hypothetical protein